MHCPFCRYPDSRVVDSRETDDGAAIRRRRSCPECGRRFTTLETASLSVVKRSGASEPFSRTKVIDGVRKACSGRPVDEDALARLGQQVEETVRASGAAEIPAHEVGLAILEPLGDARRGGLHAVRQRLPELHLARRLRDRSRRAFASKKELSRARPGTNPGHSALN